MERRPHEPQAADAEPAAGDLQAVLSDPLEALDLERQLGEGSDGVPGSATATNPGTLLDCVRMKRRVAVDLSVLRDSRNLRLLVIGEVLSGFGSQAVLVAIPFQVYVLTRSAALVGLLGLVELVPIIVCSPARRRDRRPDRAAQADADRADARSSPPPPRWPRSASPATRRWSLIFVFAGLLAAGATVDNVTRSAIVPALAGDRLRAALSITYGLHTMSAVDRAGDRRPDDRRVRRRGRVRRTDGRLRGDDGDHARAPAARSRADRRPSTRRSCARSSRACGSSAATAR